jgi:hypothetical protein
LNDLRAGKISKIAVATYQTSQHVWLCQNVRAAPAPALSPKLRKYRARTKVSRRELDTLLGLAERGCRSLFALQKQSLLNSNKPKLGKGWSSIL